MTGTKDNLIAATDELLSQLKETEQHVSDAGRSMWQLANRLGVLRTEMEAWKITYEPPPLGIPASAAADLLQLVEKDADSGLAGIAPGRVDD